MITIQEAIERTEKSETTIRRLVTKYKGSKHIKLINGVYHIDESFLYKHYPPVVTVDQDSFKSRHHSTNEPVIAGDQFGSILDNLQEQIRELHQRIREQNHIIMKMAEQRDRLLKAPVRPKKEPPSRSSQAPAPPPAKPPQMVAPIEAAMMVVIALGMISLVIYMFITLYR